MTETIEIDETEKFELERIASEQNIPYEDAAMFAFNRGVKSFLSDLSPASMAIGGFLRASK